MVPNLLLRLGVTILAAAFLSAAGQAPQERFLPPAARTGFPIMPICIPVAIGSEGPFLFGFDTGISPSTVTEDLARRLRLPVVGSVQISDASAAGHHVAEVVQIPELATLGHVFEPHRTVVVPKTMSDCPEPTQGTLGLSLFQDFIVTVDLQAGILELSRGRLSPQDANTIPYWMERSMPMVRMEIGPGFLRTGIDTGGHFGIMLPAAVAAALPVGPAVSTGRMHTVSGYFPFTRAPLAGTLAVAGNRFRARLVSISDHFPMAIMGRHLLGHFILTFDQKSHLVHIAPHKVALLADQ